MLDSAKIDEWFHRGLGRRVLELELAHCAQLLGDKTIDVVLLDGCSRQGSFMPPKARQALHVCTWSVNDMGGPVDAMVENLTTSGGEATGSNEVGQAYSGDSQSNNLESNKCVKPLNKGDLGRVDTNNSNISPNDRLKKCWPLPPESVDLVILPHSLDFSDDPELLLSHACRALKPEGEIIIYGFNPISLWGIRHYFSHQAGAVPWGGKLIPMRRIIKGLNQGHVNLVTRFKIFHQFASQKEWSTLGWLGSHIYPYFGNIYCFRGQKKAIDVRVLPVTWHKKKKYPKVSTSIPKPISQSERGID